MGKERRQRQKLHITASPKEKLVENGFPSASETAPLLPLSAPKENIFAGLNIDFTSLKSKLSDDVQSVKSFKSTKSELSNSKILKKEKLKLRRQMLMKKLDVVNQARQELKIRKKRKNNAVIGDTNPLHDSLPSLESLLKSKNKAKSNSDDIGKKSIEKSSKRKKELLKGVNIFKQTLKNKYFVKNPLQAISQHVKAVIDNEKLVKK